MVYGTYIDKHQPYHGFYGWKTGEKMHLFEPLQLRKPFCKECPPVRKRRISWCRSCNALFSPFWRSGFVFFSRSKPWEMWKNDVFFRQWMRFQKKRKHWVKIHGVRREKNDIWKEMINWWIYFFGGKARWWEFRYGSFSLFLKFVRTFEYQCVDGKMDEDIEDRDVWGWWYGYGWIIHHWIFPKI